MEDGTFESLHTPAYLVPESTRSIFSPQALFQSYGKGGHSAQDEHGITLHTINSEAFNIGYKIALGWIISALCFKSSPSSARMN
jgi:hypothetical protein